MQISITDEAKNQIKGILENSNFKEPALRVTIAGMG